MDDAEKAEMNELLGGHTFRMRSSGDMFRKLHREMERYRDNVKSREIRIDSALNFAWTAWHLFDWHIERNPMDIREIYGATDINSFRKAAYDPCPALRVFDVIANAAKHGGRARVAPERPDIDTVLAAEWDSNLPDDVLELIGKEAFDQRWHLSVLVNGKETPLYVLMQATFRFWYRVQQSVIKSQVARQLLKEL